MSNILCNQYTSPLVLEKHKTAGDEFLVNPECFLASGIAASNNSFRENSHGSVNSSSENIFSRMFLPNLFP
jgi:hypothetical protein